MTGFTCNNTLGPSIAEKDLNWPQNAPKRFHLTLVHIKRQPQTSIPNRSFHNQNLHCSICYNHAGVIVASPSNLGFAGLLTLLHSHLVSNLFSIFLLLLRENIKLYAIPDTYPSRSR
jgi:hypothetical protein